MNKINVSNIACLIITFNPDEGLLNLVKTIYNQVGSVIIVDNFSRGESISILNSIENNYKVNIIRNNENFGIAKALNQGVSEARDQRIDFVLTFDQDSTPFNNIVDIIDEVFNSYQDKNEIGAIGVNYISNVANAKIEKSSNKLYFEKDYLITSGCMISVDIFFQIGGFREDFFIDNVDIEYSLKLKKNGKKSLISTKPGMMHKAGDPLRKKILGFTVTSSNHNSFRRYFMSRNHIIVTRDYFFTYPYFILKLNFFYILSILKIIVVEKDVSSKLKKSFKGIRDAFNYSFQIK
jgi:rhamnosyltransferase